MRTEKSSKNNFIMQAGILAAAGMISRIIGLLYRSPMTAVIGELGLGYYQAAYGFYTIVLLVSSYSIPQAISKVIAQKLALREYRNAHRLFHCALLYTLVVGAAASLFLFFGAGFFVEGEAVPVLRTFAPTIFLYGFLGVLRGYFQAHKSMVQTSVSQILEQIANAVVSVGAAYLLITSFMGTIKMPDLLTDQISRAQYGAVGSALGTGAGVLIGLLFMVGIYFLNRGLIMRRIAGDRHEELDSYGSMIRTITFIVTPFILSTAIYNLCLPVNNAIYTKILPQLRSVNTVDGYRNWGVFTGISMTISNIPIAFATAMVSAMIPALSQLMAADRRKEAREKIYQAVKVTLILSIPCAIAFLVLPKPIIHMLFPGSNEEVLSVAAKLLIALAVSVPFCALSTLSSSVLQGLGKVNTPIVNSAIALVLQTLVAVGLLFFTDLDLYSMAIANMLYAVTVSVLNQLSVRRFLGYRQEFKTSVILPTVASLIMGAAAYGVYEGMMLLVKSSMMALPVAVVVAVFVYFVALIVLRAVDEQELRGFPKGHLLVKAARKMHLLRS